MSQNIILNGYNLQSSTVITSKFDHEGIGIDQCKLKLPHRAGEKFIAYTYASRKITLEGHIVNQTSSDQDNNIDLLKQSTLGAMAVPLTFDYAGGSLNRKYNVNVVNVILPRDYYTLTYIPFSIEVEAVDPPYAQDLVSTNAYSTTISGTISSNFTIYGSANPRPKVTLTVTTKGTLSSFTFMQ